MANEDKARSRRWTGTRKAKEPQQNTQTTARINKRLDETEQLIKDICNQKGVVVEGTQVETDLNIEMLETPSTFNGVLKHYQKLGFSWLVSMFKQRLNPLLCDQMGLGKTIQIIAFFLYLAESEQCGPFLVICPNSLLNNWVSELKRFGESLNVWPYWGNVQYRQQIRQGFQHLIYVNNNQNKELLENEVFGTHRCPLHVLVTSYSLAVQDIKYLNRIPWLSIVLDEGQMIKSSETKRWFTLMQYKTQNKILLSGTPVQNSLDELWSLLHFVMPDVFQSKENFADWFGRDIESAAQSGIRLSGDQLKRLHEILRPFVLRREKKDVAQQLGEKIEKELICRMSCKQQRIYKSVKVHANLGELLQNGKDEDLNNIIMQLRKVVNHPQIFGRNMVQAPYVLKQEQQRIVEDVEPEQEESAAPEQLILSLDGFLGNKLKPPQQKPVLRELSDIMKTLATLYERNKDVQNRESYIQHHIRDDQGLFEFVLPKIVVELFEYRESFRHFMKNGVQHSLDVFSSLCNQLWLAGRSESQVRAAYAIAWALCQNNVPSNFGFCSTALYSPAYLSQRRQVQYLLEECAEPVSPLSNLVALPDVKQVARHKVIAFPPILLAQANHRSASSHYPIQKQALVQYSGLDQLLEESGKLQELDRLLSYLFETRQTCLVYCQMTKMMDILEDYLAFKKFKFVRLDGTMSVAERKTAVDRFMTDQSIFVFLLSTRAGSLGLNLTRANNVIFYESDWNPTSDAQASDRAHRIGQTRNVQVWKIICGNSIDERIIRRGEEKMKMQQLVLSGQQRDQYGNLIGKKSGREVLLELLAEE